LSLYPKNNITQSTAWYLEPSGQVPAPAA